MKLVPLAVAELFGPIHYNADHRLGAGRVFDRRGDDKALPVGRNVVLGIGGAAKLG